MADEAEYRYEIRRSSQFKKDYRRIKSRGLDTSDLRSVIMALAKGEPLGEKFRDHSLGGSYFGHRECHIRPDSLLVYLIDEDDLVLTAVRTGTHSDLF
jgi:mRNA interferase YafQ